MYTHICKFGKVFLSFSNNYHNSTMFFKDVRNVVRYVRFNIFMFWEKHHDRFGPPGSNHCNIHAPMIFRQSPQYPSSNLFDIYPQDPSAEGCLIICVNLDEGYSGNVRKFRGILLNIPELLEIDWVTLASFWKIRDTCKFPHHQYYFFPI